MIRQREDIDLISDCVKRDVIKTEDSSMLSSTIPDIYYRDIVAFEVAITKAKEGSRSPAKYHLFSRTNLRIYDDFDKLKNDLIEIENNSSGLLQKIEIAGFGNDISSSMFEENLMDDISLI